MKLRFIIVNHLMRVFIVVVLLAAGTILALSAFLRVDLTVEGQGTINNRSWIDVKTEISGIIARTYVREGQKVEKSQLLLCLDDRERRILLNESQVQIEKLTSDIDHIKKRKTLLEIEVDNSVRSARAALGAAQAKRDEAIRGPKAAEMAIAMDRLRMARSRSVKLANSYRRTKKAYTLKIASKLDVENVQYDTILADAELSLATHQVVLLKNKNDKTQIRTLQAQVDQKKALLSQALARREETVLLLLKLKKLERALQYEKERELLRRHHLELTCITSPLDGVVLTRDVVHLKGRAVAAGEVLLRVADTSDFVIDCRFCEADFPLIKPGQHANVSVRSFPKGEYKLLHAVVTRVGVKSIDVSAGQIAVGAPGTFPVELFLHEPYAISALGHHYAISPGFSADVDIIVRTERVFDLLLRRVLRIKGRLQPEKIHPPYAD